MEVTPEKWIPTKCYFKSSKLAKQLHTSVTLDIYLNLNKINLMLGLYLSVFLDFNTYFCVLLSQLVSMGTSALTQCKR